MYKYGIVAIGYNNLAGIKRLLNGLNRAHYCEADISLIISIDYSGENDLVNLANDFKWAYGTKYVISHEKNLGLRKHVLKCGDYLNEYSLDALVVFEDDMYPSEDFFDYVVATTNFYIEDMNIAGVSLYNRIINQTVNEVFYPLVTEYDTFFFQYAQSRGQIWFRNQWNLFMDWYEKKATIIDAKDKLPCDISRWPETSWLKYHILYCIENDKYFVYPYVSVSTCFGEAGTHLSVDTNKWQVPLSYKHSKSYKLMRFDKKALKYDVYFENQSLGGFLNINNDEIEVDLYSSKELVKKKYYLTTRKLMQKPIKTWGKKLIPHELNIISEITGEDIFLYELNDEKNYTIEVKKSKEQIYIDYLNKWMTLQMKGKSIVDYLILHNWKTVGVYGNNIFSKLLYMELHDSNIEIICLLDKQRNTKLEEIENCYYTDRPNVDIYIVASFAHIKEIKKFFEKEQIVNFISLDMILEEMDEYGDG